MERGLSELWAAVICEHPWYFAACRWLLGACFGSFLNVVIYRLPRGMSLSMPRSHCPRCGKGIRWYHNVPVLGWLMLRGKCYDCRAPISARYPLVEGWVGLIWMICGFTELFGRSMASAWWLCDGPDTSTHYRWNPEYVVLWIALSTALTILTAIGLIRYDGQHVPRSLWLTLAVVVGGSLGLLLIFISGPSLHGLRMLFS